MRWLAVLVSCTLLGLPALAGEIEPAERWEKRYDANIPGCQDPLVLGEIAHRFAVRESRFWVSSLRIVSFENVRQTAWRPWGLEFIPRRFCTGTVLISDGVKHQIDFSVREDLSFIGASWGTDWCIRGLDRYDPLPPSCQQAQP